MSPSPTSRPSPPNDATPDPAPSATPAPAAKQGSSNETTFACKANVGEDASGCGTVYDSGGLRVEANCDASGLAALATVPHAVMTAEVMDSEGESFGSTTDSSVNRGFDLASQDTPQGDCIFVGKVSEL